MFCDDPVVAITAGELCSFLIDLDAFDRVGRPVAVEPEEMSVAIGRLVGGLDEAWGRPCAVDRRPPGSEFAGSVTVPGEVTAAGAPITLVVGWCGPSVAFASDDRDVSRFDALIAEDEDFAAVRDVVFAAGFAFSSPVSALVLRRPHPRLFSARTGDELVRQVRGLPAEVRERLCAVLDVPVDGPGERPPSLDVLTGEEVLAEVERVEACVAVLATPPGSDARRWAAIDDVIVDGGTVAAVKAIRDEFGGGLKDAVEALGDRASALRRTRPRGSAVVRGRARPR